MNMFPRLRFIYVSPWLLASATGLLVLIVLTFTLNNIQREKQLMTQAMLQKADTLMRIVHSGARSSYFSDMRRGIWNSGPWNEYVQRVIDHVAEDPDIKVLAVVDDSGKIVAHNNPDMVGKQLNVHLPSPPKNEEKIKIPPVTHRVCDSGKEGKMFEAVRLFFPYQSFARSMPFNSRQRKHRMRSPDGMMMPGRFGNKVQGSEQEALSNYYIVVGLDMSSFYHALKRLKLQAFILSFIMLLVGIGGWLSLAIVQGYRVSQKTLEDMRAFTGLLVAKLPVGIIATDTKGCITTLNAAAHEMTGVRTDEASGRIPEQVLPEEFASFFVREFQDGSKADEIPVREKEILISVNGNKQVFLCHLNEVRDDESKFRGQVLLISNLTELKGLEKEMRENERMAAVGRMAAGVAHEVRNPLSSVKGLALLLKNKFDPASRESETAGLLIQEVERMNRTVSELLSFARPASLDLQQVSLGELLDENLRLIASDTQSNNIVTRLVVAENLKPVLADRDRLNQVFINLLLNGIQSMEKGGELTVKAQNSESGENVIVTVQDSGCGIVQENLPQLFFPYFTTKPGGTGIGLAISQKIISDHKGSIRIESELDEGTTVTVEFPIFAEKSDQEA